MLEDLLTHATGGIGSSVPTGEDCTAEQCAPTRSDLSFPGMGCHTETAQGELQAPHQSEEDGHERAGAHRDEHGGQPCSIIPCAADHGRHDAVETDHQHEGRQTVLAAPIPVRLQHLDVDGNKHESSLLEPKQLGPTALPGAESTSTEGQGQRTEEMRESISTRPSEACLRDRLLDIVAHASLLNPDNWCFINSTIAAYLWCTLSLREFEPSFWGKHCNTLQQFVLLLETQPGNLSMVDWFRDVLQCWGRQDRITNHGPLAQHDAAEFIGSWLHQLDMQPLNMSWERRLEENAVTHTVDESTSTLPLFLQFAGVLSHLPRCTLTDLVKCWHQANGMVAALLQPSQALCIHVDRCIQTQQTIGRCTTIIDPDADCIIPMFSGPTLQCEELEYYCVAIQSHLGSDAAGHYRTAMRIRPTVTRGTLPSAWLLCDDGIPPVPVWELPDWFLKHATVMWLIRGDCLGTPEYADSAMVGAQPTAVEAMLALLQMPKIAT